MGRVRAVGQTAGMTIPAAVPATQPLALVAGASRGLGLLIARELGLRGYRLVICARDADELVVAGRC